MKGISRLLQRHGRNILITFEGSQGTYNPATGQIEGGETVNHIVRGYFYDSTKENQYNSQIESNQRRVLLKTRDVDGALIPVPKVGDTVQSGNDPISIYRVDEIADGEQILFYICRLTE